MSVATFPHRGGSAPVPSFPLTTSPYMEETPGDGRHLVGRESMKRERAEYELNLVLIGFVMFGNV